MRLHAPPPSAQWRSNFQPQVIYSVRGGIEDWAYAGSWGQGQGACDDSGGSSYPTSQSIYSSDMLRAINFLVETTDDKRWHFS
jgi:hypothetical protein